MRIVLIVAALTIPIWASTGSQFFSRYSREVRPIEKTEVTMKKARMPTQASEYKACGSSALEFIDDLIGKKIPKVQAACLPNQDKKKYQEFFEAVGDIVKEAGQLLFTLEDETCTYHDRSCPTGYTCTLPLCYQRLCYFIPTSCSSGLDCPLPNAQVSASACILPRGECHICQWKPSAVFDNRCYTSIGLCLPRGLKTALFFTSAWVELHSPETRAATMDGLKALLEIETCVGRILSTTFGGIVGGLTTVQKCARVTDPGLRTLLENRTAILAIAIKNEMRRIFQSG